MKVAVVGCGYVGLVTGAGLASLGHDVGGIETDQERRRGIAAGLPPFHEPQLPELLAKQLAGGRFRVSADLGDTADAEVVLLAVQTPANEDGAIDLQYVESAADGLAQVFAARPARRVVAVRSTVVPGTVDERVAPRFPGPDTAVASNPEFLREGSAVEDFLRPDRVVVGCHEPWGARVLEELYRPLGAPVVVTTPATAELAKYASNAFLATLISFSNEIARAAEGIAGVDVEDVLRILHDDRRLSPVVDGSIVRPGILSYLKAGCGYGGSCLPKDLSALLAARRVAGAEHPLLEAVRAVNDGQPARVVDLVEDALGEVRSRKIGVLGLAFKGGTDDVRSSPGLRVVDELLRRGAEVIVYDPLVGEDALRAYDGRVGFARELEALLDEVEAAVVTTNAPEFSALDGDRRAVIVDGRRFLPPDRLRESDRAIGRGPVNSA